MESTVSVSINEQIENLERDLLVNKSQVECPLKHNFAPGVYMREITMPAGSFVIGHEHLTEHFNVVLTGKARVMIDGVIEDLVAPCYFISKPNVRKVLYIVEEMKFATIHPTNETSVEVLENTLIRKSNSFIKYEEAKALLNQETKED
jgi:hypothetical protein